MNSFQNRQGNNLNKNVSLVFSINNQYDIDNIIKKNKVILNLFVDYKLLSTNLNNLNKLSVRRIPLLCLRSSIKNSSSITS